MHGTPAFLLGFPLPQSDLCPSISRFMAFVHTSVNEMSKQYLANERRYNYTTPKSFLELVSYGELFLCVWLRQYFRVFVNNNY